VSYFAIHDLSVKFHQFQLQSISLAVEQGQTLVLLGPSGSGKSVLLETVAGFYLPARGRIELAGREITFLPPEERGLGFMFQDYALFPHLTVGQNVAFGLTRKEAAKRRVSEVLELVGASHLRERRPAKLSGGEKQRVALARALAIEPRLFLFDEPLSALDARMREELRDELRRLLRSLGATSLYVTHDRIEALVLADIVAVIHEGVVRQVGEPQEVFSRPADAWVAAFLGMQVLCPDQLLSAGPNRVWARIGEGQLEVVVNGQFNPKNARLVFRPEDVRLERLDGQFTGKTKTGMLPGIVEAVVPLGLHFRVEVNAGVRFSALLSRQEYQRFGLKAGDRVLACFDSNHVLLVPSTREEL
jgi:ABC-type Fe3+/spermidine/putrescine transport system ATPase subunit